MNKINALLAILSLSLATACEPTSGEQASREGQPSHQLHQLELSNLRIETAAGLHRFRVYTVSSPEQMRMGLMHVEKLPQDTGMLFAYGQNRSAAMWMRNTLISLDILFIRQDGTIANIHKNAKPHDETSLPSQGRVYAALEINGGLTDKLNIQPGDRVSHPIFR